MATPLMSPERRANYRNRLIESRLTPNAISLTGLALNVVAAVLVFAEYYFLGGIAFACYASGNAALAAIGYRNHARFLAGDSPTRWISSSWDTWAWVTGRPSSISARARAIQRRCQVENFLSGEKIYCISWLAYREDRGLSYLF